MTEYVYIKKTLGDCLREQRKKLEIPTDKLASELFTTKASITAIERNEYLPSRCTLIEWIKYLKLQPADFKHILVNLR